MNNKRKQVNSKIELYKLVKPITLGQNTYWNNIEENIITLAIGPAGSGKSFISAYKGLKYLLDGKYEKLIITRPIVECGEKLGHLPGTEQEKIHPYLRPILDILLQFLPAEHLEYLIQRGSIDICPLAYSRGLTFHNAFCLLTEAQNASLKQLKMFLTRLGKDAKMVIEGDVEQSDLIDKTNGLKFCFDKLKDINEIGLVELNEEDIVRNELIKIILRKLK